MTLDFPQPGETGALLRVVFDSSVLLSGYRSAVVAGAALRYYDAFWSSWLVGEFVRKRTEWVARRAIQEGCRPGELRERQRRSRQAVNAAIDEMSRIFRSVDWATVPAVDLNWLADPDDWPVMQTALAAQAAVLVTENTRDFPHGQWRNNVQIVGGEAFLAALYRSVPKSADDIRGYLGR